LLKDALRTIEHDPSGVANALELVNGSPR